MKKLFIGLCALCALCGNISVSSAQTIPPITGTDIVINGQHFLLTESNGVFTATSEGPNGSVSVTTPTSAQQAIAMIQDIVGRNNPANSSYYSASEIEARLGGDYEQNSGQAAALISITKWGLIKSQPNIGLELGLLQGNQNGSSGTAGAYAAVDYRKIIGDVACVGGVGVGWDNYNKQPFGLLKAGVEYRNNAHLGEWVDLHYGIERGGNQTRGYGFAAGVCYIF